MIFLVDLLLFLFDWCYRMFLFGVDDNRFMEDLIVVFMSVVGEVFGSVIVW